MARTQLRSTDVDITKASLEDITAALSAAGVQTVNQFAHAMSVFALDQAIASKQAEIEAAAIARDRAVAEAESALNVKRAELEALRTLRRGG